MFKKDKFKFIISSVATIIPIAIGLILWDSLPEKMPVHWDASGNADNYASKPFAVFVLPLIMLALHFIALFTTHSDPKNKNQNQKIYNYIYWLVPIIALVCSSMTYVVALGKALNVTVWAMIVLGLLFSVIGNYLPKCKPNYTIGIRIPWTLNSENNWYATHRIAGKVWLICGILVIFSAFLPQTISVWAVLSVLIIMAIFPIVFSYVYHKKGDE